VCRHDVRIIEYVPDRHMCVDTVSNLWNSYMIDVCVEVVSEL
jgi:hypothetical protein